MPATPNLGLPLIEANQTQKHLTHNEALRALDALTQLSVAAQLSAPPSSPVEGARFLVGLSPSGAFTGQENKIALFVSGQWVFYPPKVGWSLFNEATGASLTFNGATWIGGGVLGDIDLGVFT